MIVSEAIVTCSTAATHGLNQQIIEQLQKANHLVKIEHPLVICHGKQNNPYLQPQAYNALILAVNTRSHPLIINSCLRTVVQQRILRQQFERKICGIKAAAIPPLSNHQSGLAIDIEDAINWIPYLKKFDWHWLGKFDPMHFDYKGSSEQNLGKLQILEFQRLWNQNNKHKLLEDGVWGVNTASAIDKSPCNGWV